MIKQENDVHGAGNLYQQRSHMSFTHRIEPEMIMVDGYNQVQ